MVRATSRIPLPFANMLAARRRLASNFCALPLGRIQTFIGWGVRSLEGLIREDENFFARKE